MSAGRAFIAGSLGVIALRAAVAGDSGNSNETSSVVKLGVSIVDRIINPAVALIPDRSSSSGNAGVQTGKTPGGLSVGPVPNTGLLPGGTQTVTPASYTTTD